MMPTEAASGVESLIAKIRSTVRQWGPLSVPTLSVKLGVAPLHIRDAVELSDGRLVIEQDLVYRRESCTPTAVEAHVATHGSMSLEALAMAVGRDLASVEFACRRSRKIQLVRQSLSSSAPVHAIFQGASR